MKLDVFDFISESIEKVQEMDSELELASEEIKDFLKEEFDDVEFFLNLSTRIKTELSLKEKILRNNYYLKYKSPEDMIYNLSDLIGVRVECRFIEDESRVYKILSKKFNITEDDKYYRTDKSEKIFLKLCDKQPQEQKNGFKIYRIDGKYYFDEDNSISFELQIKSLVNVFWSDIEHKILYKNYNYLMMEDFFRDIMSSIKENLEMIDRQLLILYDEIGDRPDSIEEVNEEQLKAFLSSIIHKIYLSRIKYDLGFAVDFKKLCDVVVEYIFRKLKNTDIMYKGSMIMSVVKRFGGENDDKINLSDYIEFERYVKFEDDFTRDLGEPILGVINKDFMWNLLFTILFEIEPGNNAEDFEGFITFFRDCFLDNLEYSSRLKSRFEESEREEVISSIMTEISDMLKENTVISFVNFDNVDKINNRINYRLSRLKDYDEWRETNHEIREKIRDDIKSIVL